MFERGVDIDHAALGVSNLNGIYRIVNDVGESKEIEFFLFRLGDIPARSPHSGLSPSSGHWLHKTERVNGATVGAL